jgi:chemotaxis protein methyltransferase CheR
MRASTVPSTQQRQLSKFVAEKMGLHFPPEHWSDLQRGLAEAATEFGFEDVEVCADWLLSAPLTKAQLQTLASHLTIGETYFFREKQTFEVLAHRVLPDLIHSRRGREQQLRLWSAGCCTGEEAYSLAILLQQLIPDLVDWQVTILATDINPHFLQKAAAASYGEWSFRDAPVGFKELYFQRNKAGRYVVAPKIKAMVTIEHLNLAEDGYPSLATDTNAMDLIFCRNVLMYFTPAQARKAIGKLHRSLLDGGWLAVSPCEASQTLFAQFATQNFPGLVLYRKSETEAGRASGLPPAVSPISKWPITDFGWNTEPVLRQMGRLHTSTPPPESPIPSSTPMEPPPVPELPEFSTLARALANQGKLAEALTWCDRWIAAEKLNAAGHYLRAVVLLEQGDPEQARRSLQRAIYLHPDFVLAHFALGNLARRGGRNGEADKHFANTLHLLAHLQPDTLLPESDGLTAARLAETIMALTSLEHTR